MSGTLTDTTSKVEPCRRRPVRPAPAASETKVSLASRVPPSREVIVSKATSSVASKDHSEAEIPAPLSAGTGKPDEPVDPCTTTTDSSTSRASADRCDVEASATNVTAYSCRVDTAEVLMFSERVRASTGATTRPGPGAALSCVGPVTLTSRAESPPPSIAYPDIPNTTTSSTALSLSALYSLHVRKAIHVPVGAESTSLTRSEWWCEPSHRPRT